MGHAITAGNLTQCHFMPILSLLDLTDVPGGTMAQRRYPPVALIECVPLLTSEIWVRPVYEELLHAA